MKIFVFASKNITNIWAGVGARLLGCVTHARRDDRARPKDQVSEYEGRVVWNPVLQ